MSSCLVLLYHAFGERAAADDPHNLFVPADALRHQLHRLRTAGRTALDLDGYLDGLKRGSWPRGSFLVTIDDGYVSTLDVAAPILAEAGVPALLFVPAARVGGTSDWMPDMPNEPLLGAQGLRALPGYGVEVGCHGLDHKDMRAMSTEALHANTATAADVLADLIGTRPRSFAYPGGWYDAAAAKAVAGAGFAAAFAIKAPPGRFTVPRVDVTAVDTQRTFEMKIKPWWPRALRAVDRVPRLRRAAHHVIGMARR